MGTLYELTTEWLNAIEEIESGEGGDIAAILARVDEVAEDWTDKATNYAKAMRDLEVGAAVLKEEIDRLTAIKKRKEAAVDALKARMMASMKALGMEKAETPIGTWKIGKGRESVEILDATKVPDEYLVHPEPTVSKVAIMAAYKETGEIVPGTEIVRKETFGLR